MAEPDIVSVAPDAAMRTQHTRRRAIKSSLQVTSLSRDKSNRDRLLPTSPEPVQVCLSRESYSIHYVIGETLLWLTTSGAFGLPLP